MADAGGLNVGMLWAQIGVDTTALKSGLADVDKSMEKTASGAKQSAEKASTSWSGVGKALGGLAIAKFATDSVTAFAAAQQSTVALQDAFARFPRLADSSATSIGKISQALADKSRFDSGAIKTGAAVLAQFGLTGQQVEATLPALVDYAAKTGKDIPAAAVALQKAALGSTKPLKDLGITGFKATGDRAKDMATVLGLVGQKTRGFAETDVHSVEGGLAVLQKNFTNVKEAVGEALVPALTSVTPAITAVAAAAQKGATFFGALPGPLRAAGVAIAGIYAVAKIGLFSKLTAGFATFRTNMNSLRTANAAATAGAAGMTRFGAAARAAGMALGNVGKGIMGAFGGPLGLALVGVTVAVGLFQAANEKSTAAVEAHNAAVKSFSDTLNQATGDLGEASFGNLREGLLGSETAFKAVGLSLSDVLLGVVKGGPAFSDLQQKLMAYNQAAVDNVNKNDKSIAGFELLAEKGKNYGVTVDGLKAAALAGGAAQAAMAGKVVASGASIDDANNSMNGYRGALEKTVGGLNDLDHAHAIVEEGTEHTKKAFHDVALAAAEISKVPKPELFVAQLEKAQSSGKSVESVLKGLGLTAAQTATVIKNLGDKIIPAGDGFHYFTDAAASAAGGLDKTTTAANDLVTASEELKTSLDGYTAGAGRADTATQFLQLSLDRLAGRSQQANDAHRLLETSMRAIVQTARAEAGAHDDVTRAQIKLTEAKAQGVDKDHSAVENALAVRKAESDVKDAIDKVTDAQNGRTDADVAAKNSILQQVAATGQAALRTHTLSQSVDIAAKRMDTLRGSFIKQQIEAGKTPKQAKAIADSYGLIPKNVRTTMIVENSTANRRVGEVSAALAKLPKWQQIDILAHNKTDAGIAAAIAAINALPVQRQVSVGVTVSLLGDPAAIAYARSHGISQQGAGHFASGGAISGGTAGVDSVPIMAMPGEHVLTARDVNRLGGQAGAYRFRRALAEGRVGKYAGGGTVPAGTALAGIPAFQPGDREGNVVGALGDLASAVADFAQAAADARGAASEAHGKLSEAQTSQRQTKADQKSNVAGVKTKDAERLKAAEDALTAARHRSAKTAAAQASKHDAIVKAEAKLTKVRHDNAVALAAATAAQTKANNAETAKVKAAQHAYDVDKRAAVQATRRAAAEANVQAREAGMRHTLITLGRQYDLNAAKVANLSDKLTDLQGKAADTTNSIAGNVAGIGGGILGSDAFTGSSTNAADMIKSLQQNLATAKGFDANIAKLVALGLNPAQAEKVANADIEGRGGVVASALAGASKAQIAQINSLLKQEAGVGTATGKRVANAEYGAEIHATDVQIKATQLNMKIEAAEAKTIGDTIAKATRAAMLGQTVKITIGAKELNGVIAAVVKTEHSAEVRHAAGRR